MTRYTGVTGQGLPRTPYITTGGELAVELHRLAHLAAEIGDLAPCQVSASLDLSVIHVVGTDAERAAVIDGLSHTLAGRGTQHVTDSVGGGVLRRTIPADTQTGRVGVVVYGQVHPDTPAPDRSTS